MELTPEHYRVAKIAYEGYCKQTGWRSLITGAQLPAYDDLKPEIKDAWAAAGIAVHLDLEMAIRARNDKPAKA